MTKQGTNNQFPDSVWDGLSYQYDVITDDKQPSFFWADKVAQEVIAIEEYLTGYADWFYLFAHPGPAGSFLSVKNDQSGGVWRSLVAGSNITLTPTDTTMVIAASSLPLGYNITVGEAVSLGDVLYIGADGKAYKAQAVDPMSQAVGLSDRDAVLDASIIIMPIGDVTKTGWGLVAGTLYFLSQTVAGGLTSTAPATTGQYVVPVGVAVSATVLAVNFRTRVKL
jgi:hypothetical protein